jgi:Zn-dependent protease/predicted transcriptional regulator
MSWSFRIGRLAGIDIYLHFTFLILLAWVGISTFTATSSLAAALLGLLFIAALFTIVVLHELGHALAARRYGIETRDITLLPIGGLARLARIPEKPQQELVVALAGPAVNVVLAVAIYIGLQLFKGLSPMENAARFGGDFISQLFYVNVMLAAFNLLPAFPMDGGRVLRALLAMRMDYVRATQIAAMMGQGIAVIFILIGLFSPNSFMLIFIGLFVWLGASQEAGMAQMRSALATIPVMRAMITEFHALRPDDRVSRALDFLLAGFQQDFPVVVDGRPVGVLTRQTLAEVLSRGEVDRLVGDVMQREFVSVAPGEMLQSAFEKLRDCACHTLPVVQNDQLVGLMTSDNVAEVLMIQEALRTRGSAATPSAGYVAGRSDEQAAPFYSART